MEQFTYSDIFATKGIEYIIVIAFLLLIIPVWRLLSRPVKIELAGAIKALKLQNLRIPQGLLFNRNHTWTHLEKNGVASVGVDDLLLHLTGGVELNYLKERSQKVERGEAIARIVQEGKELLIKSPISGEVEQLHASLEDDGSELSKNPYSSWLCRIKPENWKEESDSAMMAEEATEWTGKELERFKDYLAESTADEGMAVLQEGGELGATPLKEMDGKVWEGFQKNFLDL